MFDASAAPRPATFKRNARNRMGGMTLLRQLRAGEASAAFLDPQYRALLDKMRYGNEGTSRERARVCLPQMTDAAIASMLEELERVLEPSGHLFLWVDKFGVGSGHHLRLRYRAPALEVVDILCWNKARPGMGRRLRCSSEYVVVLQKRPLRAKGRWSDRRIPDCWTEQADRSRHPHAKPSQLVERLIRATTRRGDLVVDPCAGSYVVLEACHASGREFAGCDLI
jgi:site-specific DNA-methyltransferase (adenine-specific)